MCCHLLHILPLGLVFTTVEWRKYDFCYKPRWGTLKHLEKRRNADLPWAQMQNTNLTVLNSTKLYFSIPTGFPNSPTPQECGPCQGFSPRNMVIGLILGLHVRSLAKDANNVGKVNIAYMCHPPRGMLSCVHRVIANRHWSPNRCCSPQSFQWERGCLNLIQAGTLYQNGAGQCRINASIINNLVRNV